MPLGKVTNNARAQASNQLALRIAVVTIVGKHKRRERLLDEGNHFLVRSGETAVESDRQSRANLLERLSAHCHDNAADQPKMLTSKNCLRIWCFPGLMSCARLTKYSGEMHVRTAIQLGRASGTGLIPRNLAVLPASTGSIAYTIYKKISDR